MGESKSPFGRFKVDAPTIILGVLLLVFIYSAAFFALKLRQGIIPDEPEHFILSKHFATSWGIPADAPVTYAFGPVVQRPMAFYWINGRALNLLEIFSPNPSEREMLVSLRLMGVFYSALAVFYCYFLAGEILKSKWWQLLAVFMLTNTLMFVFLSGGVNYDNLSNLCAFAGIYYLVSVLKSKPFYLNSLAWMTWIGLGTLSKITILPLAAIMAAIWIFYIAKKRTQINLQIRPNFSTGLLTALFVIVTVINFSTYGISLLKNRAIFPECRQILTEEQCTNGVTAQRSSKENLPEKLTLLSVIRDGYPDPIEWFLDFWIARISVMNYGIFGHLYYFPDITITFFRLFFILMLVIAIRYWEKPDIALGSLLTLTVFYTLVLLQTNYQAELISGFKHIAIQGRYIFPVIGIIYILMVHYLSQPPNTFARRSIIYFVLILFLWSSWVSPLSASFLKRTEITAYPAALIPPERSIAELQTGIRITQSFTSQCHGTVDKFYLKLTTPDQENSPSLTLEVFDVQNKEKIAEQTISGNAVTNDGWSEFSIDPLNNSLGNNYQISITSPNTTPEDAATLWGSQADSYLQGQSAINDEPIGSDISFAYQCTQPAFSDWFE